MSPKPKYTEADLYISHIAKFSQDGDIISHTHTVIFGRPLTVAERRLFTEVLTGFYYTAYFSQQFGAGFVAEPIVEFHAPEKALYTLRQTTLSGAWKDLLFAVLLNFSREVAPIALHDESKAFAPEGMEIAAD